ncbi:hypothetical protein G7Y89_g5482 [Cudoniella acicularis]|uniref:SET domain-containing protein n=1 Tax=Cudoniella acicularis TaxID=354080 RepID=A0A8H4W3C4_9HELO|nr:hypothetical protein G7Y89_g5482 [Cudoniella acicularis]
MIALRRKAAQTAERLPAAASRRARQYSTAHHGKTGDGAHHADHGHHHHAEPVNENLGAGFFIVLAAIPITLGVYAVSRADKNGKPAGLSTFIDGYSYYKEKWAARNTLHTAAIEQAAFDRNLFHSSKGTKHVDLRFPEIFNTGSPFNVIAGQGARGLDEMVAHYEKLNADEVERKAKSNDNQSLLIERSKIYLPYLTKWAGEYGEGMFAARDIPIGAVIITEPCLLTIKESNFLGSPAQRIQHLIFALDTLPPVDRKYVESLHPPSGGISAVIHANGFAFDDGHVTRRLYHDISKINHSCRPNADLDHGKKGIGTARALRDITKGEEITMLYGGFGRALAQIEKGYGFRCRCGSCTGAHEGTFPDVPFERVPEIVYNKAPTPVKKLTSWGKIRKAICEKWNALTG